MHCSCNDVTAVPCLDGELTQLQDSQGLRVLQIDMYKSSFSVNANVKRCREPALAAFEADEVLQKGSLAFVSGIASSVANGVLGVAKAAAWGRQSGYRAGVSDS